MENVWAIIIGVVLIGLLNAVNQLRSETVRTNLILEKISKQIGVPDTDIEDELKSLIAKGKRAEAIKRYREFTGVGLKESKEYVDSLSE
jgi:ribosomal protein L7/L12